ncbi:hypothetical protein [Subtercola sp. RTI3]|uniref:hypothetical protein n=1 Tax=Subtercola sp. RTI3 TaxID=3048639 RepID=UPI002B22AF62|nr:hypothetical protein [Subtercola sp. RTI3]MEA9985966.1 hypothetical protein [Subtercola sp. RTI3]
MIQLLRWVVVSGAGIEVVHVSGRFLSKRRDAQLAKTALILIGVGWVISVGDLFLPVMIVPPPGLIAFILTGVISIVTNVAAALLAGNLILRHVNRSRRIKAEYPGHAVAGGSLLVLAAVSFIGERMLGLVVAIHG